MTKKIFILFLFLSSLLFAEDVNVKLSQGTVGLNESFSIVFTLSGNLQEQPDFAPLQTDFTILSKSHGFNTSLINGRMNQEATWTLELVPKHEGLLTIPSIPFGKSSSPPKTIEVTPAPAEKKEDNLFLEIEISPKEIVYAQTPLTCSIRLYRTVNLAQGSLTEVKVNDPDAMVERLGQDIEYEHFHQNGSRYMVLERRYVVIPQHTGELLFSPVVFEGKIVTGGNSFFNTQTQYKRVNSDQDKVEVKPIPAPFHAYNWLPAYDVKLKEEWSSDPNNVKLGEPITWTLTLIAEGCMASQIPEISLNIPAELKHYLDKPQIDNQVSEEGFTGVKKIKVALIPTKPGAIPLPDVKIKWWDLDEDQIRETLLQGTTLQVQPGEIAMNIPQLDQPLTDLGEAQVVQQELKDPQTLPLWAWSLIGLNGVWMIGGLVFLFKKIGFKPTKSDSSGSLKAQLKKACHANDPKLTETSLLAWAAYFYPEVKPLNLIEIKQHLPETLQGSIDDLYQALYGQKNGWEGGSLWKAIAAFNPKKKAYKNGKVQEELLRNLYSNE